MTDVSTLPLDEIVWDPKIYPRSKWSTSTIERYVDAMEAGDVFPPLVLEEGTHRLLDGKHRFEAYKARRAAHQAWLAKPEEDRGGWTGWTPDDGIPVEWHAIPEGMTPKYYAATLSARHGDRMSNADLKALAEEDFEADPSMKAADWGRRLGVPGRSVSRWVSHITERERRRRTTAAWRLYRLGWTQKQIAAKFNVSRETIDKDLGKNGHLADFTKRLPENWNEKWLTAEAERLDIGLTEAFCAALDGKDDEERFRILGIKIQPYDVWHFASCHDLMGDAHPGRIPGELIAHVLWRYTQPGDLVIDPMVGSGTTLDACLLMGRRARGYDIDERHERIDVEQHDLSEGWPDSATKADLVFWDPPYFDKMDSTTIGEDGYIDGSVSKLDPDDYLAFFAKCFAELHAAMKPGARLAFLMSDWDPENAKDHGDCAGIFQWDYADALRDAGFEITRQIQCPLSTQQVHPDIVNKFRESRRLARLGRYLLIGEKR